MQRAGGFQIFLRSNDSMDVYPDNKISHFINKLQSPLYFRGAEYAVGLRSIGYHKSWLNLGGRDEIRVFVQLDLRASAEGSNIHSFITDFKFPQGYYKSQLHLFRTLLYFCPPIAGIPLKDILTIRFREKTNKLVFSLSKRRKSPHVRLSISAVDTTHPANPSTQRFAEMLSMDMAREKVVAMVNPRGTPYYYIASHTIMKEGGRSIKQSPEFFPEYGSFFILAPSLVDSSQMGDTSVPLLAHVPVRNRGSYGDYIHYEIDHILYHKCSEQLIPTIEIQVQDVDGKLVEFRDYVGPFVVCLDFQRLDTPQLTLSSFVERMEFYEQRYVYCNSTANLNTHPNNLAYNFRNTLISPIVANGDWEVAVTDVSYTRPSPSVDKECNGVIYLFEKGVDGVRTVYFRIPPRRYRTIDDIVNEWNNHKVSVEGENRLLKEFCEMQFLSGPGRLAVKPVQQDGYSLQTLQVNANLGNITPEFALFTGLIANVEDSAIFHFTMTDSKDNVFLFPAPPDMQQHTFNIWLTSVGLVEETQVGSQNLELLDVLPVQGDFNTKVHYTYARPHYRRVLPNINSVREVSISLRNSLGDFIDIPDPTSPVMVGLHFRKRVDG